MGTLMTYDVGNLRADIETSNRNSRSCLVADIVLDQNIVGGTLNAYALVPICDLWVISYSQRTVFALPAHLIIVDPVVLPNSINAIVAPKISPANSEVVHFDVPSKLEDEVKLGAIDKDEIVETSINRRHNSD